MKVPEPRKLPSGTWFIQMRLNGVSVPVSAPTKKECIRQAQLIKAEHRAETRVIAPKSKNTIKQIMKDYVANLPEKTSPATVRGYNSIIDTRFLSVSALLPDQVKDWQKVIDEEAAKISAKTLKNSWGFVKSSFRAAHIAIPEVKLPQVVNDDRRWLEPDDLKTFITHVKGNRFEIPTLLALHGLRRSEIFAMTYEKISLKEKTITIHGAAVIGEDNKLVQKDENKNVTSRRVIPILIPELSEAIEAIPQSERTGLVYTANPTTLYWYINKVCEECGFPKVGVHGLRHSFASLAYHLGLSEQETMELGGWADYNTMRKIYTHLAKADRLKAQNKIAVFFNKNANENANESPTP